MSLRVTVIDEQTGEGGQARIPDGEFVIFTTEPCHVHAVQEYGNGTVQLTVKGRRPLPLPPDPIPEHEGESCRECYERGWAAAALAAFKSLPQEEDE